MIRDRRAFLTTVTAIASVGRSERGVAAAVQPARPTRWDVAWIDALRGRHKIVYDLLWHTLRPNSLNVARNYLDIHEELNGLTFPEINVVIGANSTSFPINASDAQWAKFHIGERYNIMDPDTSKPAERNVYLGRGTTPAPDSVRELQRRGAVFMMCNNSLKSIANDWSRTLKVSASDLHAELTAGLNAGVKVVPALTWAVSTLQERGFTYEKL